MVLEFRNRRHLCGVCAAARSKHESAPVAVPERDREGEDAPIIVLQHGRLDPQALKRTGLAGLLPQRGAVARSDLRTKQPELIVGAAIEERGL